MLSICCRKPKTLSLAKRVKQLFAINNLCSKIFGCLDSSLKFVCLPQTFCRSFMSQCSLATNVQRLLYRFVLPTTRIDFSILDPNKLLEGQCSIANVFISNTRTRVICLDLLTVMQIPSFWFSLLQSGVAEVIYFVEKRLNDSDIAYVASHKLLAMANIKVRPLTLISWWPYTRMICFGDLVMVSNAVLTKIFRLGNINQRWTRSWSSSKKTYCDQGPNWF